MGNCLISNNKVSAQDHEKHESDKEAEAIQHTTTPIMSSKKKTVRFKLQEDEDDSGRVIKIGTHDDESKSGVVRIRLVVTQQELKQLLNYKNDSVSNRSSVEQLLSSLKSRSGRRISADQIGTSTTDESWRPVLESIPEDQC
ncbi:hypothetical protein M0R45_032909 [Rubus argutus]|uniref:Uncharacterized protein n=1 Tax=Rubus argutus TaxID=59490 RepID=A0AAW1WKT5_RUBAR